MKQFIKVLLVTGAVCLSWFQANAFAGGMETGGPTGEFAARSLDVFGQVLSQLGTNGLAVNSIKFKTYELVTVGVACTGSDVREVEFSVADDCLESRIPTICRPIRTVKPLSDLSTVCR